jgi:hypothetical protein
VESAVPDEALVIRGGDPHVAEQLDRMYENARLSYERGEGFALSTFVGHDPHKERQDLVEEIARVGKIPNSLLACTYARELRRQGFTLVADGDLPGHANVILGDKPDRSRVKTFIDTLGAAEPNPVARERRAR